MRSIIFALLLLISPALMHAAKVETGYTTSPPQPLPVPVETSIYLWKIENIDEKNQTFTAYIYLDLKWHDPRLVFEGESGKPMIFTEDSIDEKFKEIWWPETDFVNAIETSVNNKSLAIYPDGEVNYSLKISGTFFTPMNFEKFPFDSQSFQIHLESFFWMENSLKFVVDQKNTGFAQDLYLDRFDLESIDTSVKERNYLDQTYSQYEYSINLKRHTKFYLYQILVPMFILLAITGGMFFIDVDDLSTSLFLGQGAILVLIAMKFMINESLPHIDYLTIIDYVFFAAYFCCGTATAIACIHHYMWRKKHHKAKLAQRIIWIPVVLFLILYFLIFYFMLTRS